MAPYARPVVDDIHGRLAHLLVEDQDLDRSPAACGATPFPGRWRTQGLGEQPRPWCKTCAFHVRQRNSGRKQ